MHASHRHAPGEPAPTHLTHTLADAEEPNLEQLNRCVARCQEGAQGPAPWGVCLDQPVAYYGVDLLWGTFCTVVGRNAVQMHLEHNGRVTGTIGLSKTKANCPSLSAWNDTAEHTTNIERLWNAIAPCSLCFFIRWQLHGHRGGC